MTGMQMLLKQIGLDPEKVVLTYNQITTNLPIFLNALGQKVSDIEARLAAIEKNQQRIMEHLGVTADGNTNHSDASASASRVNGASKTPD